MRGAVITTLRALYEGKEVTANNGKKYGTTRIANEIGTLRNGLGIDIITDRIETENKKWYGSYRPIRTEDNLAKARAMLEIGTKKDGVQESLH